MPGDPTQEFDPLDYHTIVDTVVSVLLKRRVAQLPIKEQFTGAGIYVIYYRGNFEHYAPITNTATSILCRQSGSSGQSAWLSTHREYVYPSTLEQAERARIVDRRC